MLSGTLAGCGASDPALMRMRRLFVTAEAIHELAAQYRLSTGIAGTPLRSGVRPGVLTHSLLTLPQTHLVEHFQKCVMRKPQQYAHRSPRACTPIAMPQ
jgi:hypothetical protein